MKYKKIISYILAVSLIFNIAPVSAIDGVDEAETVTATPAEGTGAAETEVPYVASTENSTEVIATDEEIISTDGESVTDVVSEDTTSEESETEVITETTVTENTDIIDSDDTVAETIENLEAEDTQNVAALFSIANTNIELNKVSETDSSISISWSSVYSDSFAYYDVYCNGIAVQTGITDNEYTVTGLAGGNEYGISVYAYDVDGNVIGMSETEYFYTNWNISGDTVLTSDKVVSNLYANSGTLDLNGHTLTVKGDMYVSYATLNINKGKVYVDGNFGLSTSSGGTSGGYLTMTNAEDYI
ncbi:MAG: hypothetical protein K2K57_03290, partial [Oscillospiraceae bacterium]|nr:hypothetical protein [Oscillospiraceae bacterium]